MKESGVPPSTHNEPANLNSQLAAAFAHASAGKIDDAILAFRQVVSRWPQNSTALNMLGVLTYQAGKVEEGISLVERAIEVDPTIAEFRANLGEIYRQVGRLEAAVLLFQEALARSPELVEARYNLGKALHQMGRNVDAVSALRSAIDLRPNYADCYNELGNTLLELGRFDEATLVYLAAIDQGSDLPALYTNLGRALAIQGRGDEAIAAYRRELDKHPDNHQAHSNLALMLFQPGLDGKSILEELKRWAGQHTSRPRDNPVTHSNDRQAERRLRIGYVSPNFCDHVVGRNVLPVLRRHSRSEFEIFCYSSVLNPDHLTTEFRRLEIEWRDVAAVDDAMLAEIIRRDRIDILVDLSLHMAGNRLFTFARKPAPVQVTFAGYPGGTGLPAIDYRLTDPYLDPPGTSDGQYVEKSVRLANSFWCYDADAMELAKTPDPGPLPALSRNRVIFGCLNKPYKTNSEVLALWSKVMKAVPNSGLIVLAAPGAARELVLKRLGSIEPDRVEFVGLQNRQQYFETYQRIDIGLDTFPYNGHTTSLDSLWMGVPVISLVGETAVGRAGFSQLSNLGLTELVAKTKEEYVNLAVKIAGDLDYLSQLRRTLRSRMKESTLVHAQFFTRNIELAYRGMWKNWCQTRP